MIPCNRTQELNEHAEEEAAADIRKEQLAERIEARAQELMQPGGSCYPFKPENFQEALANMGSEEARILAEKVTQLDKVVADNDMHGIFMQQAIVSAYLLMVVRDYWSKTARYMAEKEMPL